MLLPKPVACRTYPAIVFIVRERGRCILKPSNILSSQHRTRLSTMSPTNGTEVRIGNGMPIDKMPRIDNMAYSNCKTKIVDLKPIKLPENPKTPDSKLRQLYKDYINVQNTPGSQNDHSGLDQGQTDRTDQVKDLVAAILSLKTGIAPPVAFPTETVYGLGADATNPASVAGIFAAKGRPSDNPLIVHVSSTEHLERCLGGTKNESAIPNVYKDLLEEFWPGPLTVLIPVPEEGKGVKFAPNVHPGQKTIGFRVPSSPYARFLLAVTDRPIAGPSANSSGKPSPTTVKHVKDDLDGKINFILDGGSCDVGVESTVVDGLGEIPLILRPGGLSKSVLRSWGKRKGNIWQHVENGWETKKTGTKRKRTGPQEPNGTLDHKAQRVSNGINGHRENMTKTTEECSTEDQDGEDHELTAAPRAPGMKYKHYAPKGRMFLFEKFNDTASGSSLEPVRAKLGELLIARDTGPNNQNGHPPKTTDSKNISATIHSSAHTITVGVLVSTSWPSSAKIHEALLAKLDPQWRIQEDKRISDSHNLKDSSATTETSTQSNGVDTGEQIMLKTIELGKDSAAISRNLFAALRTCDDLGCDWIFAEAPSRATMEQGVRGDRQGSEDDVFVEAGEDFETILERMRKAASEIVQG